MFKLFKPKQAIMPDNDRLARLQRREAQLQAIKQDMGEKYILHPSHKVTKLNNPRSY